MNVLFHLENVCKSFGEKQVLKGIDLKIYEGETAAIMGQSGAGKTVLMKVLLGFLKPDEGFVFYRNKNLYAMNRDELYELRKNCAVVFQNNALFDSMSVYENLSFVLEEHTNLSAKQIAEKVKYYLSNVGLEGCENLYPAELSGGMQKRLAVARALCIDAKVLFFDEPTTGLDPVTSDTIIDLIKRIKQHFQITAIIITHNIMIATKLSDRIIFIEDGKIADIIPARDIKSSNNQIVKKYLETCISL